MTGMPRNFRPIIGSRYEGPRLDRPALRQLPSGWVIEEARKPIPAWWRFWANPDRLIVWLVVVILVYAACSVVSQARAADKPQFRKAEPSNPVWSAQRCRDQGRTWFASSSDGRAWKVRCTGRPVRT